MLCAVDWRGPPGKPAWQPALVSFTEQGKGGGDLDGTGEAPVLPSGEAPSQREGHGCAQMRVGMGWGTGWWISPAGPSGATC